MQSCLNCSRPLSQAQEVSTEPWHWNVEPAPLDHIRAGSLFSQHAPTSKQYPRYLRQSQLEVPLIYVHREQQQVTGEWKAEGRKDKTKVIWRVGHHCMTRAFDVGLLRAYKASISASHLMYRQKNDHLAQSFCLLLANRWSIGFQPLDTCRLFSCDANAPSPPPHPTAIHHGVKDVLGPTSDRPGYA